LFAPAELAVAARRATEQLLSDTVRVVDTNVSLPSVLGWCAAATAAAAACAVRAAQTTTAAAAASAVRAAQTTAAAGT
jgi:hypothetical protein